MNKIYILILCCFLPILVMAQTPVDTTNIDVDTTGKRDLLDIGNKLFKFKPRKYSKSQPKQYYFAIIPISTSVPGGGAVLVTAISAGFYTGPRSTTYLSSVNFAPYLNFRGRYGLPVHSSIWVRNNTYNIQGDIRFLVYPQYTWGLGGGQPEGDRELVNYDYIRFYQTFLKRITPYLYVGLGYNMDYFININTTNNISLAQFTNYPYGTAQHENSFSSGISLNLLYDSRQNIYNPIPGVYANVILRENTKVFGSDNNSESAYIDLRKYVSLSDVGPKNQLAFWTYYWTTLSSGTPYLDLPSIGNDPYQRSGRGIEQNRERGNGLFYFETEYRRDITANGLFGFVVFANVNSATQGSTRQFAFLNPAAGTGLRVKFNKKSETNICLDYGISKGYSNITVALGEAF